MRSPSQSNRLFRFAGLALVLVIFTGLSGWTLELGAPADEILRHARYLASSELTGRGVDTPGIKLARNYIANEFASYGLRGGGDEGGFLQAFDVTVGAAVKQPTRLTLGDDLTLKLDEDWTPLGFSASGKVHGQLVFAGYGITTRDKGYDDYAGLDVRDKIVVLLRFEPPPTNDQSPFKKAPDYSRYATLRSKANNAKEHGAAGIILVDLSHHDTEAPELLTTRASLVPGRTDLIAVQVKRRLIEPWFARRGISLAALKETIDRNERPASTPLANASAKLQVSLEERRARAENVIGILPGSDPVLRNQFIVIGAHYDHLGFGRYGARNASAVGQIHPGADDNASGTAVLLDFARRIAQSPLRPACSIVFAAFSAEELGLFGSRHFVERFNALKSIKAMLNLDMVGRMKDHKLTVFGARSGANLSLMVRSGARDLGLEIRESDDIGRSDHMSFYNKKIPVLHFSTGVHQDYHRPSDTWDKLNGAGMAQISALASAVTIKLAAVAEPINFVSLPSRPPSDRAAGQPGMRAYLGTMPDYAVDIQGVRVAAVSPDSPAARAGLLEGDVIVQLADRKIQNIEDLTSALQARSPGDEVALIVLRKGVSLTVKATLRARS